MCQPAIYLTMTPNIINKLIQALDAEGVVFIKGLADSEVSLIESTFEFTFPEDLKAFLQTALPVSPSFLNWRAALKNPKIALERLAIPLEDLLLVVQKYNFWLEVWGERPTDFAEQKEVFLTHYAQYPTLIPIYSHRFMPSMPTTAGNPVFSMVGTDIIHYGSNLYNYLINEFYLDLPQNNKQLKNIPFWSYLVDLNT